MKKTYSTLIFSLGIGIGGLSFAQQPTQPIPEGQDQDEHQPDTSITSQKNTDAQGNGMVADSTWSWTWSGDAEVSADLPHHFQELVDQFRDGFNFHFNDSTLNGQYFQELFGEDFNRKLEELKHFEEPFNEEFFENLNEKLEKLQEADIHFQWDQNFNQHLEQGIEQMLDKWQQFYQEHQGDFIQPRRKAL